MRTASPWPRRTCRWAARPPRRRRWPEGGFRWADITIAFDPESVPPGTYGLYVGLYTYPDITRLPVNADRPRAQDGLLYVQDITLPPLAGE